MKRLMASALLAIALSAAAASSAAAGAAKFTFNNVTFSDGTLGELEASSKTGKNASLTTCSYYADNYASYLGYYDDNTFASADAAAVEQFCLDYYADRATR